MGRNARGFAYFLLLAMGAASHRAQAANLYVNCDKKETIHKALKLLADTNPQPPNKISVVGHCRENILIQSMDRLTLITIKDASITDRSGGTSVVVDIEDSRSVAVQGFKIKGGSAGVSCGTASVCNLTGNTIQGGGFGVTLGGSSQAFLESNVIQNNVGRGAMVVDGSRLFSSNDLFQNNGAQGAVILAGAYFHTSNSSFLNNSVGIEAGVATVALVGGTLSGNGGNGMTLLGSASATLSGGTTITGNAGDGVYLEDGSFAGFLAANITGNLSGLDVECAPQFPITRFVDRTGGITNCVEPGGNAKAKVVE